MKYLSFLLVLISSLAFAAGPYGTIDYSSSQYWPKKGLIEYIRFGEQGITGVLAHHNMNETWDGTVLSTCTSCPANMYCVCTAASDITPEITEFISDGTSVKMVPRTRRSVFLSHKITFEPYKMYTITFWARGGDGTEDLNVHANNYPYTEAWDWNQQNEWKGAPNGAIYANIGTTWKKYSQVLLHKDFTKTDYYYSITGNSTDGTAIYIDDIQITEREFDVGSTGNAAKNTKSLDGAGGFGDCADCIHQFGSEPPTQYAGMTTANSNSVGGRGLGVWVDTSTASYYQPTNFDEYGNFSAGCKAHIYDDGSASYLMSNNGTTSDGWYISMSSSLSLVSYDTSGSTYCYALRNGVPGSDRVEVSVLATVQSSETDFNATSNAYVYFGAASAGSDTTCNQPPYITDTGLCYGAARCSSSILVSKTTLYECAMWNRYMEAWEARKWTVPHFPGTEYTDQHGFYPTGFSGTNQPIPKCSKDRCTNRADWDGLPEYTGSFPAFYVYNMMATNNSFETYTGDISNPAFTDWEITETPGDGTASVTAYLGKQKHLESSARLTTTGTTPEAGLNSKCVTYGVGNNAYLEASVHVRSRAVGSTTPTLYVNEYSDALCTVPLASTAVDTLSSIESDWNIIGGVHPTASWTGGAASYDVYIAVENEAADILIDNVSIVPNEKHRFPWYYCESPAANCSSGKVYGLFHNPLSDYIHEESAYAAETGACIGGWVFTDWDYTETSSHTLLETEYLVNANIMRIRSTSSISFDWYNSSGASAGISLSLTAANWPASTWKYIEVCSDSQNPGTMFGHHYVNGTWYAWSTAAGDQTRTGAATDINIGVNKSDLQNWDGYVHKFFIAPYDANYTNTFFNDGVAPPDPY